MHAARPRRVDVSMAGGIVGLVALLVWLPAGIRLAAAQDPPATPTVAPYLPPPDLGDIGGEVFIDGSSTVWPITAEAATLFTELAGEAEFVVEFSSTGDGFARFCEDRADLQNASRPISTEEQATCAEYGVRYYAFPVAFDGIAVVVHPSNDFVTCLTVAQLELLWRPDDPARTWRALDPAWPDREIERFGPDENSGTFDFFTAAILGEAGRSTDDYEASQDDNELVEAVAEHEDGLAYFGLAYYAQNSDRLKLVAVDGGVGCVAPSAQTVADGGYAPLSRPLYVYVQIESLARSVVREFMRFYLAEAGRIAAEVGYVPLTAADYVANQAKLEGAVVGNAPADGP